MLRFGYAATVGSLFACFIFACGDKGYVPHGSGGTTGPEQGGASDTGGTLGAGGTTGAGNIDGGDSEAGVVAIDGGGGLGAGGIGGGTGGTGGSTTAVVSYAKTIAPMMSKSCGSTSSDCHGTSDPTGLASLDTYASVKAWAAKSIKAIQDGTMPKAPNPPLSDSDFKTFQAWVSGGYPQ